MAEKHINSSPTVVNGPYSASNIANIISNNFGILILGVGVFVVGFVTGSLWTENKSLKAGLGGANGAVAQQPAAAPVAEAAPLSDADWKEIQKNPVFTLGQANAKVTMVEFTDYQCPFCARHYTDTHKQLIEKYVKNGDLKIIYKDQALTFHPNANSAAQSVRCANEQKGAEAMHDALFGAQVEWASLTGDALFTKYSDLATKANLNGQKIVDCVKSEKFKKDVDADIALGNRVGAGGTPTFFIEGKPLVGAQPLEAFDAAITAAKDN